ncbi:MAG TPA: HAD family phosphatase, partial [Solirubrobacterales bacterium]
MAESHRSFDAVICDFGGVLTTPLIQSFLAFQDETGITTEKLGQAMATITEANGTNPLFELERGEITEARFLEQLAVGLEPGLGHRPELHRFKE